MTQGVFWELLVSLNHVKVVSFKGSLYRYSVFNLVQLNVFNNDLVEEEKVHLSSLWKTELGGMVHMWDDRNPYIQKSAVAGAEFTQRSILEINTRS